MALSEWPCLDDVGAGSPCPPFLPLPHAPNPLRSLPVTEGMDTPKRGFTLIEMLVVIGIIAAIAAILFPVFASVRERGRRTACLSNERQLGMAMLQYVADSSETFPGGLIWAGDKWVSQTYPYVKSTTLFRCPSDGSTSGIADATGGFPVSYGLNSDLALRQITVSASGKITQPEGFGLAALTASAKTLLFFEVGNGEAVLDTAANAEDGSVIGNAGATGSGSSDGKGGTLTDPTYPITSSASGFALYATGNVGGRLLNGATKAGKTLGGRSAPRHAGGANYVACDGHAVWLRPEEVSGGDNAAAASDPQKAEANYAAGTAGGRYALTFSRN